jgi:hypothetical protein
VASGQQPKCDSRGWKKILKTKLWHAIRFHTNKQQKAFYEVISQVARSVINAQSNLKFKVVVLAEKFVPFFLVCRIVPSAPKPFDERCDDKN